MRPIRARWQEFAVECDTDSVFVNRVLGLTEDGDRCEVLRVSKGGKFEIIVNALGTDSVKKHYKKSKKRKGYQGRNELKKMIKGVLDTNVGVGFSVRDMCGRVGISGSDGGSSAVSDVLRCFMLRGKCKRVMDDRMVWVYSKVV